MLLIKLYNIAFESANKISPGRKNNTSVCFNVTVTKTIWLKNCHFCTCRSSCLSDVGSWWQNCINNSCSDCWCTHPTLEWIRWAGVIVLSPCLITSDFCFEPCNYLKLVFFFSTYTVHVCIFYAVQKEWIMQFHYLPKLSIFFIWTTHTLPTVFFRGVVLLPWKTTVGRLDHSLISLYIDNTCSNTQVMRIKEAITKNEISWFLDKFSLLFPEEMYGKQWGENAFSYQGLKLWWFPIVSGLTLDPSSDDFVDGKVVGVSHDLYMKGCVQDVTEGIKVRNLSATLSVRGEV